MRVFILVLLSVFVLGAQESAEVPAGVSPEGTRYMSGPATVEVEKRGPTKLWWSSVAALTAAGALDAHSSWGKCCESNRLLANGDGTFSHRGAAIKAGVLGGQLALQRWVLKKSPSVGRLLSYVNFGSAAVLSAVAIRNYGVPQPGGPR